MHKTALSKETVAKLIQKPLEWDFDGVLIEPKKAREITATHGTKIEAVSNLAIYGKFKGGHKALEDRFYVTPNLKWPYWHNTCFASELFLEDSGLKSAFQISEAYATIHEVSEENSATVDEDQNNGVIIGFNRKILEAKPIAVYYTSDEFFTAEMELPAAPSLDTIAAIYPVGEKAAQSLATALSKM